jgi:dUTPase
MVTIKIKNLDGINIPKTATEFSAGYDIIATSGPKIIGEKLADNFFSPEEKKIEWWKNVSYIEYETDLAIAPTEKDIHILIIPRSSIGHKTNLVLSNSCGLIDNDYRGKILFRFRYIWQPYDMAWLSVKDHADPNNPYIPMTLGHIDETKIYKKGDAIGQMLICKTMGANFELVPELDNTKRGSDGFGSSDSPKPVDPNKTSNQAFEEFVGKMPGASLSELYQKSGGIPIKKKYIDEVKGRK